MNETIYIRYTSKKDKKILENLKINLSKNTNTKLFSFLIRDFNKKNTLIKQQKLKIKQLKIMLEHHKNQVF